LASSAKSASNCSNGARSWSSGSPLAPGLASLALALAPNPATVAAMVAFMLRPARFVGCDVPATRHDEFREFGSVRHGGDCAREIGPRQSSARNPNPRLRKNSNHITRNTRTGFIFRVVRVFRGSLGFLYWHNSRTCLFLRLDLALANLRQGSGRNPSVALAFAVADSLFKKADSN